MRVALDGNECTIVKRRALISFFISVIHTYQASSVILELELKAATGYGENGVERLQGFPLAYCTHGIRWYMVTTWLRKVTLLYGRW